MNHKTKIMRKILSVCLLAVFSALAACSKGVVASGPDETKVVNVGAFTGIEVSGAFKVNYTVAQNVEVKVTAPQSIMPYIVIRNHGKDLVCYFDTKKGDYINLEKRNVVINIKAPMVDDIEMSGASSFELLSNVKNVNKLDIEASGASVIKLNSIVANSLDIEATGASSVKANSVTATKLELDASGASKVTVAGKAERVEADASGASSIDMKGLTVGGGSLEASGASSISTNSSASACRQSTSGASSIK